MKRSRTFGGKSYIYVGTYWDPEVIKLCLNSGRAAGYLMRQAKVPDRSPLFPGSAYDIFAYKTSRATGPLMVPVVVRGTPRTGEPVGRTPVPGQGIVWTEVSV